MPRHPKTTEVGGTLYYNRDVRGQLRSGDVLLFRGDVAFSRLIEAVEGGNYSHSAFVLRWNNRAMVAQAEFPRLEAVPTSVAVERYTGRVDWYRIRDSVYSPAVVRALTHEATRLLGRRFAVADLLRVGIYNLLHKPIPREDHPDEAMFCSEYVAHCFRVAGIPLAKGRNDHAVTPDQIAKSPLHEYRGAIHWDVDSRPGAIDRGFHDAEAPHAHATPDPGRGAEQ